MGPRIFTVEKIAIIVALALVANVSFAVNQSKKPNNPVAAASTSSAASTTNTTVPDAAGE